MNPVLVNVMRGGALESAHRGSLVVLDADGAVVATLGDVDRPIFPRSAIKLLQALPLGQDNDLPTVGRVFFYMPLMHAESPALQDECVMLFEKLVRQSPPELQPKLAGNLRAAREHADIVARFGRFPHRNAVLGRPNTPEEHSFLTTGPRFGQ